MDRYNFIDNDTLNRYNDLDQNLYDHGVHYCLNHDLFVILTAKDKLVHFYNGMVRDYNVRYVKGYKYTQFGRKTSELQHILNELRDERIVLHEYVKEFKKGIIQIQFNDMVNKINSLFIYDIAYNIAEYMLPNPEQNLIT